MFITISYIFSDYAYLFFFVILGMAFKEEFEYLAFQCCYCNAFNPARKKRPTGPRFDTPRMLTPARTASRPESSDSSEKSCDDSDAEVRHIIYTVFDTFSKPHHFKTKQQFLMWSGLSMGLIY